MSEFKLQDAGRILLGFVLIGVATYLLFTKSIPATEVAKVVEKKEPAKEIPKEKPIVDPLERKVEIPKSRPTRSVINVKAASNEIVLPQRNFDSTLERLSKLSQKGSKRSKKLGLKTLNTAEDLKAKRVPSLRPPDDPRPLEVDKREKVPEKLWDDIIARRDRNSLSPEEIDHQKYIIQLLQLLASADPQTHLAAGVKLRSEALEEDVPVIANELKQGHADRIQLFLIETLTEIGPARDPRARNAAMEALVFEFEHGEKSHRPALVRAIGAIKHVHSVPFLAQKYRSSNDLYLRRQIILALGKISDPDAAYALRSIKRNARKNIAKELKIAEEMINGNYKVAQTDQMVNVGKINSLQYKGTPYLFYTPTRRMSDETDPLLLVCIHDSSLDYRAFFKLCFDSAKEVGYAVLAPLFSSMDFPEYPSFNLRYTRADERLWELIDFLDSKVGLRSKKISLFGAGEGGMFAYRLALTNPYRILRAAFTVEEHISVDDESLLFPEGLRANPFAPDLNVDIEGFIESDILILGRVNNTNDAFKFFDRLKEVSEAKELTARYRKISFANLKDSKRAWVASVRFIFPNLRNVPRSAQSANVK